jgi:uncharacterized DUF497 family protein
MEYYDWDEEKNSKLKKQRGIGFGEVVDAIHNGRLVDVIDNPSSNFPKQKVYIVKVNDYIYYIPFVKDGNRVFLKTIIPSRKATKQYLARK